MLKVKLFARARDLVQKDQVTIPWNDGETVGKLRMSLSEAFPELGPLIPRLLIAVNNDYASDSKSLSQSDEVACFPPVSGG